MTARATVEVGAEQRERCEAFRRLHHADRILVIPNAWDAASARVFELAGFPAIATTSAGLAMSLGFRDGEQLPFELLVGAVERITATVQVPVSVDFERGYADDPDGFCARVAELLRVGAVGINVEDGRDGDPRLVAAKVRAVRARDWPVFINARTDKYLYAAAATAELYDEAVRRLHAFEEAGADGLFVPGLADAATIGRMVRDTHLPLNIMARGGVPSPRELQALGVKRVSVGSGPHRATIAVIQEVAAELRAESGYSTFANAPSHGDVTAMFPAAR